MNEIASALLLASGARVALVRRANGDCYASPAWPDPPPIDALLTGRPELVSAEDPRVREVATSSPSPCATFLVAHADEIDVLLGFGAGEESFVASRADGLLALASLAASCGDDAKVAGVDATTVGEIVSGISHDIGTPLNVISGYAESMLMTTPDGAPGRKQVAAIFEQTRRIADMVRRMLDIVRPSPENSSGSQPLEAFAADAFQVSGHMLRRRSVRGRLEPGAAGTVAGDLPALQRAVFSALRGAARVVGPRGHLAITPATPTSGGVGFVLDATDADRKPIDLSSLAEISATSDGLFEDLLMAGRVLEANGGGIVRDGTRVFVRLGAAGAE